MDLHDLEHNTRDGLHIASLAGTWIAAVAGFGGMRDHDGELTFAPRLPARLERLAFRLRFRGRRLKVEVTRRRGRPTRCSRGRRSTSSTTAGRSRCRPERPRRRRSRTANRLGPRPRSRGAASRSGARTSATSLNWRRITRRWVTHRAERAACPRQRDPTTRTHRPRHRSSPLLCGSTRRPACDHSCSSRAACEHGLIHASASNRSNRRRRHGRRRRTVRGRLRRRAPSSVVFGRRARPARTRARRSRA